MYYSTQIQRSANKVSVTLYMINSGALNEELLETSYNELEIYQNWGSLLSSHNIAAFPGK